MHLFRVLQSPERLEKNEERDHHQRAGVDQGGQDFRRDGSRKVFRGAGRDANLQIDGPPAKAAARGKSEKVVTGFPRGRASEWGANAGNHQQHDVGERHEQGDAQDLGGLLSAAGAGVHVHVS